MDISSIYYIYNQKKAIIKGGVLLMKRKVLFCKTKISGGGIR